MSNPVQIAFDLDMNKLQKVYSLQTGKNYTNAYYDIRKFMTSKGYEHRQGSVYHSIVEKTRLNVVRDIHEFQENNKWFSECVNKIDYASLEQQHDLLPDIKQNANVLVECEIEKDPTKLGEEVFKKMRGNSKNELKLDIKKDWNMER